MSVNLRATRTRARLPALGEEPVSIAHAPRAPAVTILGAIASGLLLHAAFPPLRWSFLAWFALLPLIWLIVAPARPIVRWSAAWLGGLAFWVSSLVWVWELHASAWLGWLVLSLYQSLFWPLFVGFARALHLRMRLPLILAAPIAWVACEYIQAHALSGFPWYYLAHSQVTSLPLIQIADLFGAWGVSALVVVVNVWFVCAWRTARAWNAGELKALRGRFLATSGATAALLAATLAYGWYQLTTARFTTGPTLALLQSNMRQALKMSLDPEKILAIFAELITQGSMEASEQGRSIDLFIWPETSFPYGYVNIDPSLSPAELEAAGRQINPEVPVADWIKRRDYVDEQLAVWVKAVGRPMLVGSLLYDFSRDGGHKYNAAVWIDPDPSRNDIYRKIHLVPFGEYIPFIDVAPWIRMLAPYDERNTPRLISGVKPHWFDRAGVRYAPTICFEDTLPHLTRRFFSETRDGRVPDVILDQSNDGWFNGSAEHDMHLAASVFRSVELRAPLARAVNMGYSALVDGNGRVVATLPLKTPGTLTVQVPLDPRDSFYRLAGDWLPRLCLLVAVLGLASRPILFFSRRIAEKRKSRELPGLPMGEV